jgi:plastocyanin domain-containing protein
MIVRRVVCNAAAAALVVMLWLACACACGKKVDSGTESSPGSTAAMLASVTGQLRVVAGEHGFTPSSLALPRGAPGSKTSVVFVRTTDKTCATEVVFPDLDVKRDLPLDTPVTVDVPTDAARTLTFQCGMAMYKGALVVK